MAEYEAEPHGPHDHPVIATLTGCVVLIAAALLVPRMLPAQPQSVLVGALAAVGLLLWLIGFVATTRLSSLGWKAGSLAILLGAGALAGSLAHRQYEAVGREDPSSFAELEFGPKGAPLPPRDAAARGPVSKLFVASVQAAASERRGFEDAMGKFGAGNLNSPYLLAQNPQAIAHCGDLDAIKALAREHAGKRAARHGEIGRAIDAATFAAPMKDAIREIAAPETSGDPLLANQIASIDATGELCVLLARRGWYNANGYFGFNSAADVTRYKALQARRATLASEAEKLDRAATARMKAAQEKVRAALS